MLSLHKLGLEYLANSNAAFFMSKFILLDEFPHSFNVRIVIPSIILFSCRVDVETYTFHGMLGKLES